MTSDNRLATLKAQVEMDTPAALALLDAAQRAAERSGAPLNHAETEWNLAQIHYYSRNLQTARAHAAVATRLARQIGQPDVLARCLNVSAYVLADLGEFGAAQAYAEEARAQYAGLLNRVMEVDCLCVLAQRSLGDVNAALATHLANSPALPCGPLPADFNMADFVSGVSLGDLCADYAVLGRWDDAARCARLVAEAAHLVPAYGRLRTLWFEVEALARSGGAASAILATRADALAPLSEALALARQLNLPVEVQELEALSHATPP